MKLAYSDVFRKNVFLLVILYLSIYSVNFASSDLHVGLNKFKCNTTITTACLAADVDSAVV